MGGQKLANMVDFHMPKRRDTKWGKGKALCGEDYWFVVDGKGKYYFDCGGFVRYMLNDTFCPGWRNDNRSPRGMPLPFLAKRDDQQKHPNHWSGDPEDWMVFAVGLQKGKKDPKFELVATPEYNRKNVANIRRGDILIRDSDRSLPVKDQHMHMMIAMEEPNNNGRLWVADSTSKPHGGVGPNSTDTRPRQGFASGMGKGEIKVTGNDSKGMVAWSVNSPCDRKLWVVRLK